MVEPLTGSTNRWTDYTYNTNRDVTQTIVSLDGSTTVRTITRTCYDAGCTLTGSGLDQTGEIDNYVSGGAVNADTNVATDNGSDAYGQRTSVTRHNRDATGAVLDDRADHFVFDANGSLTAEIVNYADGVVTSPGDDVTPNLTTLARTDLTTRYGYDTAGNRTSIADPRRAVEAARGTSLLADDYITRWSFDARNQQLTETTPSTPGITGAQRSSATVYDELGLARTATDFGQLTTGTGYDATGRATATYTPPVTGSGWAVTATTYDADGRPSTAKDACQTADASLGSTTSTYDALGRQVSMVEAAGSAAASSTDTAYDGLDRRTSLTVGGQPSLYAFDLGGRVTSTDDGFACTVETFDYRDRPTTTTSGRASRTCTGGADWRTVTHTLDGLGRLTRDEVTASVSGTGIGARTTDLVFDAIGSTLSSASRLNGVTSTTTATVDRLDQTVSERRPDGSTAKSTFDAAGNLADACSWAADPVDVCAPVGSSWTNPPTQVTTTTSDALNQRIAFANAATNATTTYDPAHNYQIASVVQPTSSGRQVLTTYTYDGQHRTATITTVSCQASNCAATSVTTATDAYAYDDANNVTSLTEARDGVTPVTYTYCYDGRSQLVDRQTTSACSGTSHDEHYAYDAAGNRTSALVAGTTTNYAYDAAGRLCAVGATTCASPNLTYDSIGRTATWNGWTFAYDAEGRLISACKSPICASGFDAVTFAYDGAGHRTQIKTTSASGAVSITDFGYAGDAIVSETLTDASHPTPGTVVRRYVVDADGSIVKITIPAGEANAGDYLVTWNGHGDALNLLRINADGTTTLANSYAYSSWDAPSTSTHNGIGDLGFRFLYVGRHDVQWDNAFGLGLLYMHARHYAPTIGRFLQPDPTTAEMGDFVYAGNDPASRVDPSGGCWQWLAFAATGVGAVPSGAATLTCVGLVVGAWAVGQVVSHAPATHICFWNCAASVQANRAWSAGAEVAAAWALTQFIRGRVRFHPYFWTPRGPRYPDVCLYRSPTDPNWRAIVCLEVKTGAAPYYLTEQWYRDLEIYRIYRVKVVLVRGPGRTGLQV